MSTNNMRKVNTNAAYSPVFIKSALALVTQMLCEDGLEGTQTTDGLDVTHNAHNNNWRSFNDGDRLHFLSLSHL